MAGLAPTSDRMQLTVGGKEPAPTDDTALYWVEWQLPLEERPSGSAGGGTRA